MTKQFELGDLVKRSDIDERSIPAYRAMRGRVIAVSETGAVRVSWGRGDDDVLFRSPYTLSPAGDRMTTQDLIAKLSELSGDYQDLYDRVRDLSVRSQHEPFQRYALEQTKRAQAYLDNIVSDMRARESLPPLAESNQPARTAATEAFRRTREILKGIK